MSNESDNTSPELTQLVRKHLIDVDQHGYVEGEDDFVAVKELLQWHQQQTIAVLERLSKKAFTANFVNGTEGKVLLQMVLDNEIARLKGGKS